MSGSGGNSYTVTPWSPGSYVKRSSTSKLIVVASLPTLTTGSTGPGYGVLNVGANTLQFMTSNNTSAQATGAANVIAEFDSLPAGSYALSVTYKRADSTAWQSSFCPTSADASYLPSSTPAAIQIYEVGS
jgi:hypothetical protein